MHLDNVPNVPMSILLYEFNYSICVTVKSFALYVKVMFCVQLLDSFGFYPIFMLQLFSIWCACVCVWGGGGG